MNPEKRRKTLAGLSSDLETLEHLTACLQATGTELERGGHPEAGAFLKNAKKALDDGRGWMSSAIRFIDKNESAAQIAGTPS